MLANSVVYSSFSTDRLLDSFLFYKEVLGLEAELVNDRFMHLRLPGDHLHVVYQKEDHQPANHTVLNFQITEIEKAVRHLQKKGVKFLQYEKPIETDERGISWDDNGSHLAWFKDPGGNILALIEN